MIYRSLQSAGGLFCVWARDTFRFVEHLSFRFIVIPTFIFDFPPRNFPGWLPIQRKQPATRSQVDMY
jgi:hypothetical protein